MKIKYHEQELKEALQIVKKGYGIEMAKKIEQMARLETAHFTSKQWELSKSFGMEDGAWKDLPKGSYTTFKMNDNHLTGDKRERTFIKWNNVLDFVLYLCRYIERYDGNYGRWNSTNVAKQAKYIGEMGKIKARLV